MEKPTFFSFSFILLNPLFIFFFFQESSAQFIPPYLDSTVDASEMGSIEFFDYIIVGGGTAGCPLAATLSQEFKVLVLERGGTVHDKQNLMSQDGFLKSFTDTQRRRLTQDSPVESFTSEDGVFNARGRVLGGSSAINAGFYSRAEPDFFLRNRSGIRWEDDAVREAYEWVEKVLVTRPLIGAWQSAVRDALLQEANLAPDNGFDLDHHVGTKIGGSTFDLFGRRHTAADLLNLGRLSNLKIALHSMVDRVLFGRLKQKKPKKPSAIGVVYVDRLGGKHRAILHRGGEVILCAGAIGSPQLLLLSGIGPQQQLHKLGIQAVLNLSSVGQFMYDNPRNGISFFPSIPVEHSLIQVVGITDSGTYIEAASIDVSFVAQPRSPFLPIIPLPMLPLTIVSLIEKISGPLSSGHLHLVSRDVRVSPAVRFNYFSEPMDLEQCVKGVKIIGEVLKGRSMDKFKTLNRGGRRDFRYIGVPLPSNLSDVAQLKGFCRRTVNTIWHYHGGCLVGKVVDSSHRVLGVSSLRVVDGSTFTVSPGTNPQATVMMMGRYVGRKILAKRRK